MFIRLVKYGLTFLLILFIFGVQKIFSQGIDSTIQRSTVPTEINSDSAMIMNNNVTYQRTLFNSVSFLNILPKRGLVISVCEGIKIWKLSNGKKDTILRVGSEEVVHDLIVSRDESKMLISVNCYNDKEDYISCYSLSNFKLLWRTTQVNFENGMGLYTGDSLIVSVGSYDISFLNIFTGKVREQKRSFMKKYLLPKAGGVNALSSPSGRYILYWNDQKIKAFSLGLGNKINLWDLVGNSKVASKIISGFRVWTAAFLPDEQYILVGNNKGLIKLLSLKDDKIVSTWDANISRNINGKKEKSEVDKIIIPEQAADFLAISGKYNGYLALKIFNYPEMKLQKILINPEFIDYNWPAVFSDDGTYLAVSDKGYLSLYTTNDWKCLWRVPAGSLHRKENIY
jgi:WD40 repeat protein